MSRKKGRRNRNRAMARPAQAAQQQTRISLLAAHHSGPLPPPETFRGYEDVSPGAADRIISMAEREQGHRHACDLQLLDAERAQQKELASFERRGQTFGFWLAVLGLVGSFGLVLAGMTTAGAVTLLAEVGALIAVSVWRRRDQQKQLPPKADDQDPPAKVA